MVIGLSLLLLMAAFRSFWIPLVSAVFNLLSVAAAYGVIVAVFQKGIGASLLGDKAWWLPKWMDRVILNVSLEGHLVENQDLRGEPLVPELVEAEARLAQPAVKSS